MGTKRERHSIVNLPTSPQNSTFRRAKDMDVTLYQPGVADQNSTRSFCDRVLTNRLPCCGRNRSASHSDRDGKVAAYGLHCFSVTSMPGQQTRIAPILSFFLMRRPKPTIWIRNISILGKKHCDLGVNSDLTFKEVASAKMRVSSLIK